MLEFLDCNAAYGVWMKPHVKPAITPDDLLKSMEWCGIQRALVRHAALDTECPTVGNPLAVAEMADHPQLEPMWALLPPATGEQGTPEELSSAMSQAGVRALWAFPSKHKYILDSVCCGPLFEVMVAKNIPLFILKGESSMGVSNWELVAAVLKECPRLRLVYVGQGCWGEDRWFRPLMDRYEGLYTDTSRYELDGGIKAFVARYGPERLLFGSNFPESNPGGAMLTLAHADLTDEQKQLIAAGNLDSLLGEVQP